MTPLADVVTASRLVGETSARSGKVAILAELLRTLDADEVPICVGFLSGVPRQGRVGVGYSTVYAVEPRPADAPSLTVLDVDHAIDEIERATGPGSAGRRADLLTDLLSRATAPEGDVSAAAVHGRAQAGCARRRDGRCGRQGRRRPG